MVLTKLRGELCCLYHSQNPEDQLHLHMCGIIAVSHVVYLRTLALVSLYSQDVQNPMAKSGCRSNVRAMNGWKRYHL